MELKTCLEALEHQNQVMQNQYAKYSKIAIIAILIALPSIFYFNSVPIGVIIGLAIFLLLSSKMGDNNFIKMISKSRLVNFGAVKPNYTLNDARSNYSQIANLIFDSLAKEISPHFHYFSSGPDFLKQLKKSHYFDNLGINFASTLGNISGRCTNGCLFTASYILAGEHGPINKNRLSQDWRYQENRTNYYFEGLVVFVDIPQSINGSITIEPKNVKEHHQQDYNGLFEINIDGDVEKESFFTRDHITGLVHFWRKYHHDDWMIKISGSTLIFSKEYSKNPMQFGNNSLIWKDEAKEFRKAAILIKNLLDVFEADQYSINREAS